MIDLRGFQTAPIKMHIDTVVRMDTYGSKKGAVTCSGTRTARETARPFCRLGLIPSGWYDINDRSWWSSNCPNKDPFGQYNFLAHNSVRIGDAAII